MKFKANFMLLSIISVIALTMTAGCKTSENTDKYVSGESSIFNVRPLGAAHESTIWSVSDDNASIDFGFCSVVNYGTEGESRRNEFKKLYPDISYNGSNKWNNFTVASAFSSYSKNALNDAHILLQSIRLNGKITISGTAKYITSGDGTPVGIALFLDDESLHKLPSLKPYDAASEDNYTNEQIYFSINKDEEYYSEITAKLDKGETVNLSIETDDFVLKWTDIGILSDGTTNGIFKHIIKFDM